jgi:tetratricopeptide (TPR) repeat protein
MSEKYIDKMYTDLPKKIKNLTKVYKMYHELNKEDKKKEIEKKIYLIINNEISNNDNKAVALIEVAKSNFLIENTYKVKEDLKKASKLAENSNTYLGIAKILYKINDIKELNTILEKAKIATKSKDQEFWIIRELINISLFEDSINKNEESYKTLLNAKNSIPIIPDERLVLELVDAFARINKIEEAEKLIKLIKPKYEQSMAYAFIGKQLGIKGYKTEMKSFSDKALIIAPDQIAGNYEFRGLPGFSTKGRIFAEVAKSYALIGEFNIAYELLSVIESDRFYKEGVSEVLIIQAKNDKMGARNLASKMLEHGGKIIDNKFLGKIAYAQAISGNIGGSLNIIKTMELGFDYSQALINIAHEINFQQEDLQTLYH